MALNSLLRIWIKSTEDGGAAWRAAQAHSNRRGQDPGEKAKPNRWPAPAPAARVTQQRWPERHRLSMTPSRGAEPQKPPGDRGRPSGMEGPHSTTVAVTETNGSRK